MEHRRGPWSQHEDDYLMSLVHNHGPLNWVRIAGCLQSRTPKQCRERYHQNLKPTLNHEPISAEEGAEIERLVEVHGKRWAEIARRLHGRSDNAVKNWWNGSQNRRKRHDRRKAPHLTVTPHDGDRTGEREHREHQHQHQHQHHHHQQQMMVPLQGRGASLTIATAGLSGLPPPQSLSPGYPGPALYAFSSPLSSPSRSPIDDSAMTPSLMSDGASTSALSPGGTRSPDSPLGYREGPAAAAHCPRQYTLPPMKTFEEAAMSSSGRLPRLRDAVSPVTPAKEMIAYQPQLRYSGYESYLPTAPNSPVPTSRSDLRWASVEKKDTRMALNNLLAN